jgi:heme/copper-type cytochrome/quinol oxidase subunit 3
VASESEKLPLGLQVPPVRHGVEIPPEPADVGARTLSVAARLMAGATIFFFLAFVFAYFYLRALNAGHMWKPAHVKPNQGLGAAFVACIVLSAAPALLAGRRMKGASRTWLPLAVVSLVLGLGAIAVQCIHYTVQKFGPTDGAYASVFCIWTAMYLVAVLATMYWLETQVATELRARRSAAPRGEGDIADPDKLIAPALDAAVFYWVFLAAVGVLTYVVLYLL